MNNSPKISLRLAAAANYVRSGSFIADIGTEHAYLPLYLCTLGKIRGAVASDINEGPVARATINVASYHLQKKISVLLTDGLSGIEPYAPDDVVICGMGGELIAEIISRADWVKNKKIRLILQPMTHSDKLRKFLIDNQFDIVGETLVKEDKIYQIICAEYSGESQEYSALELMFGKHNIENNNEVFKEYVNYVRSVFVTRRNGKQQANADVTEEIRIINEIDNTLLKG